MVASLGGSGCLGVMLHGCHDAMQWVGVHARCTLAFRDHCGKLAEQGQHARAVDYAAGPTSDAVHELKVRT